MKEKREEKGQKGISISKEKDLSEWYTEVMQKAEMADYSPVKGFMVIRPNAYSIWEKIQEEFNKVLREKGVRNAYFPLLIPESFFKREAEHAEGFAPELAFVKNTDEGERLAIRPTSETIMYDSYSKWVRSWRDLPLKINQWCNVVRWEVKQTKPFLRTREFLWQEGHCVFETEEEAERDMKEMIEEYKKLVEELLAIPVLVGKKSKGEKFPGAQTTMTIESLMPDGKALQGGTSHNLGQGFAKAFDVKFKGRDEKDYFAWQTSWGFSTRLIGALTMVHGDDKGMVIPPKVALNKVVIVPILFADSKEEVLGEAHKIKERLKEFGAFVDDSENSPGYKFSEWEMKGIPVRIEVGPRDIQDKKFKVSRRDNGAKEDIPEKKLEKRIGEILEEMQRDMFEKAKKFLDSHIDSAESINELKEKLKEGKIVKVYMKDEIIVEHELKDETGGATSRIIEEVAGSGKCIKTGEEVNTVAYFARSY